MRKLILYIFLLIITISCVSVKKYNERLETPISPEKLKLDVDFAKEKLQKLHPNLYWYISKENFNYKFDSLKTTITTPLKPNEFYQKLAPVIAEIKEGHLRLVYLEKKLTKKENEKLKNQKGLFSRFNYVLDGEKLYVKDNSEKIQNMNVGTEILKIDDVLISEILKKYKTIVTSDGNNTTYHRYALARRWANFFTLEKGILDSVKLETKYQNKVKIFYLKRETKTKEDKIKEKLDKKPTEEKKTKDYNPNTKSFNRNLTFLEKDSSIAYIKIKSFSGTFSKKFYKESFETIKKAKTDYLIIDIRDNLGGSLAEINNLYSYLSKEDFKFIKPIGLASKTSIYSSDYFSHFPLYLKPIAGIFYPGYLFSGALVVKENNGAYFLKSSKKLKNPKDNAFQGKIYVLINGSSFSASSIISSKLKNDQRATLVGEETGGANDGTVAGIYSTQKLPNSHLKLPIGLFLIQPDIEFTNTKKGVTPHQEIIPNLDQILQKKDPELDWILKEIKAKK